MAACFRCLGEMLRGAPDKRGKPALDGATGVPKVVWALLDEASPRRGTTSGPFCAVWAGPCSALKDQLSAVFPFDRGHINDVVINADHHIAILNIDL